VAKSNQSLSLGMEASLLQMQELSTPQCKEVQ